MPFWGSRYLLKLTVAVIVVSVIASEVAEARKRPKREPKCSLRISEDGRYTVVCVRSKSLRKGSKVTQRGLRKSKRGKKTNFASKKSMKVNLGNLSADQMKKLSRSSVDKKRNGLLVCRDRLSKAVPRKSFPSGEVSVRCQGREFLQGFSMQKKDDKVRYKFTCCSFD